MAMEATKKVKTEDETRPVRVRVRAYDHKVVEKTTDAIIDAAQRNGAKVRGPVPLPTERTRYTVNRSTFVHKDSRDQYEMRVHKRLIDIYEITPKAIEALTNLNLPAGVDVEIKM
jgi:small subunit ribosomal protein S10